MNKLAFYVILFAALCVGTIRAQYSIDLKQGNADYPVPIPSALYALHGGAPLYLEPWTVRNIGFAASQLWSVRGTRLSVGTEIAPILIGDAIDLSEYLSGRIIRVLLRTRLSAAITTLGNSGFNTAFGLRWMVHDDADPRADSLFERTLISWAETDPELRQKNNDMTEEGLRQYHSYVTKVISRKKSMQPKIDSLREAMKTRLWNTSVFEVAIAAVYHSSPGDNSTVSFLVRRYNAFLNAALPFGRSSMIAFGASGQLGYDDEDSRYERQGAVIGRFYYGSVAERGYGGIKLATSNLFTPDYRVELGALLRVANGLWLRPEFNISTLSHPVYGAEGSVTLSFGTPEIRE